MSSGEERTHNWLLANMGPRNTQDPGIQTDISNFLSEENLESISGEYVANEDLSPVNSLDLERVSPLLCNDEEGPLSVGSGGSMSEENGEVSGITSNWISSGGQYAFNAQDSYRQSVELNKSVGNDQGFNFDNMIGCNEYQGPKLYDRPDGGDLELFLNPLPGANEDVLDEQANSGVCGLTNIGNTCFMAAGIQCLVNTPPIAQYFFSHIQEEDNRASLAGALSQLVYKIWSGKYTSIQPTTFKEYFGKNFHDFRDFRQHDCQEFLLLLFEVLRKEMPISKGEALDWHHFGGTNSDASIISDPSHTGSRNSSSPTPPHSPVSASSFKQYSRSDTQEDIIGIDSGPASPKSSISSSSTDPHITNMRMRPIPEEVKEYYANKMETCQDDISVTGTLSGHDLESVTSDISEDCVDGGENNVGVRQYNRLTGDYCDNFDCDTDHKATCDIGPDLLEKSQNLDHSKFVHLHDIITKEIRTSNVNVQMKDHPANNKLFFDSEKYGKDYKKLKSVDNLKGNLKRVKEVNLLVEKLDFSNIDNSFKPNNDGTPHKRMKLDDAGRLVEKNNARVEEMEHLNQQLKIEQNLADDNWKNFVTEGDNAVVNAFYGQYKSSIVCCACGHTSDKFEPFGTLTLPLPNASILQIAVVFVPRENGVATKYLISISKISYVEDIINKICEYTQASPNDICVAEVFDNHISRILDPSIMTKMINYKSRAIYAFQLLPSIEQTDSEENGDCEMKEHGSSVFAKEVEKPCNICLDEKPLPDLSTHYNCEDCWLCAQCIEMSLKHHVGQRFPCPVCQTQLCPSTDLIHVDANSTHLAKSRTLKVAVVFRLDTESMNNNKRSTELIGHPSLLVLPRRSSADSLLLLLKKRVRLQDEFQLLFVDGKGLYCSRCLYNAHCHGCVAIDNSEVVLKSGDTLCVRFTKMSDVQRSLLEATLDDCSLSQEKLNSNITLHDCLKAFTKKELMEGCEAWFCPRCESKQKATKTISIYRNPPFLIIHLERFLFQGNICNKLDDRISFPIDGFDMTEFASRDTGVPVVYNLYGCICHSGSSAECGHYTAVVRSPLTGEWHSFNDSNVTSRTPSQDEFSLSYILFFYRKGVKFDLTLPVSFPTIQSPEKPDNDLGKHLPNLWDGMEASGCMGPLPCPSQPPASPELLGCEPRPTCSPIAFGSITPPLSEDEPNVVDQINAQIRKMDENGD